MKKIKKLLTLGLAWIIAITLMLSGCGGRSKETASSANEEIKLKWVMSGSGEQSDSQTVWEKFNEKLKTYEGMKNVSVEFKIIPFSDYTQKFLLMQTSREHFDIAQTYQLNEIKEIRNETFMELGDLIDKNAPEIKKDLPSFLMKFGQVNGKQYLIPNYQMLPSLWNLWLPKKMVDKYSDISKIRETVKNPKSNTELYDVMETYFKAAKAGGELGMGFNPNCAGLLFTERLFDGAYGQYSSRFVVKIGDETHKIVEVHKTDEIRQLYAKMADWYQKDYIRKDVLSANLNDGKAREGGYLAYMNQANYGVEVINENGMDMYVVYANPSPFVPSVNVAGGNGISVNCEHPDKAIKLLELMNTEKGKDLYNLLVYGIEGTHFEKAGDDKIKLINNAGESSGSSYGLAKWIVGNTKYAYLLKSQPDDYKDMVFNKLNQGETTKYSEFIGFSADLSKYEAKLSQIDAVAKEFHNPLSYGALGDWEKRYEEMVQKINACQADEICAELQKQVDDFIKSK